MPHGEGLRPPRAHSATENPRSRAVRRTPRAPGRPGRARRIDLPRAGVEWALKEINTSAPSIAPEENGLIIGHTKTAGSDRTISLPAPILDILSDHLGRSSPGGNGPDDLLFPAPNGGPMCHNALYKRRFKPVVKATLPPEKHDLRFHDLRAHGGQLVPRGRAEPPHRQGAPGPHVDPHDRGRVRSPAPLRGRRPRGRPRRSVPRGRPARQRRGVGRALVG